MENVSSDMEFSADSIADFCTRIGSGKGWACWGRKRSHKFHLDNSENKEYTEISDTPEWTQDILGIQVM
mgnify:CR=1 FL=1